jgi:VWFA-related protein
VVNDKAGNHIPGLTKEQFVLKQDGKVQPITVFEEVKTDAARMRRSDGENGTFSNFEPGRSDYHRLSIIVLDFVNTPFADLSLARASLQKFLSEAADSGEPMCLLALTGSGLVVLHDFTDDPQILARGLSKSSGTGSLTEDTKVDTTHHPTSGPLAGAITAMIRSDAQLQARIEAMQTKNAAWITLQALEQIAKGFRGLPGRKSLIWASSGFPFSMTPGSNSLCEPGCPPDSRDQMQPAYDRLWRMMNDAQIAIYAVDLRSSTTGMRLTEGGVRPSDVGDPQFDAEEQAHVRALDTNSTFHQFSENTGGRAFLGGGNLVQAFHQAMQDDTSYYMLGYYVSHRTTKAGWHEVSLALHEKGARLRYRNGYILSTDTSASSAHQDIQLALSSPLDFTGVPVSVTWSGKEPAKEAGKTKVGFDLVISPGFASIDEGDKNHMMVDIAAVAKNQNGDVVADLSQRVDVHLDAGGMEQIQHNGMTYRNALRLPAGAYNVRFVVRDALGNRMGSVAAPLTVAP